jgi:hypothetical protein
MNKRFIELLRTRAMESNDGILRGPAMAAANEIEWARAEITHLRADRAELVEALRAISLALLPDRPDGTVFPPSVQRAAKIARTLLACIGEK